MAKKTALAEDRRYEAAQTKRQHAFRAASGIGDLRRQVRLATPEANRLILNPGISDDIVSTIDDLVGARPPHDQSLDWTDFCARLNAAYALGIAVGQRVSPRVFEIGGTR